MTQHVSCLPGEYELGTTPARLESLVTSGFGVWSWVKLEKPLKENVRNEWFYHWELYNIIYNYITNLYCIYIYISMLCRLVTMEPFGHNIFSGILVTWSQPRTIYPNTQNNLYKWYDYGMIPQVMVRPTIGRSEHEWTKTPEIFN